MVSRRLLKTAPPLPGESLRGLIADACARNHIPNTWGMLQHFGLRHRNRVDVSESQEIDTSKLATALAVDEAEILVRRYPSVGRSHRTFYGLQLHANRIENQFRRFSPAAIAAGCNHHPAMHELRDLPFSPIGWDLLQDRCPCEHGGARQRWTRVNGTSRCDQCGGRLDRIDPVLVPNHLREPLALLVALVSPDHAAGRTLLNRLPEAIAWTERRFLFDVTVSLGECAEKEPAGELPQMQQTYGLARACEALLDWPHGLTRFRRSFPLPEDRWARARRNYLLLDKYNATRMPAEGELRASTYQPASKVLYVPTRQCGRVKSHLISAMAAARLSGLDETALKQAWDDGLLEPHTWVHGSTRVRAFDPEEVIALAPRLRRAKARIRVAKLFGMSLFGVEQLDALALFRPQSPSEGKSQWDVHDEEFRLLSARLKATARVALPSPVSLRRAVRDISGRPKPWGPIFSELSKGAIPYVLSDEDGSLVECIAIPEEAISAVTELDFDRAHYPDHGFTSRWMQKDALECLNGDDNDPRLLNGIAFSGRRPKYYLATDVEALASSCVTTADLAWRARTSVSKTYIKLRDAGIRPVTKGLWDRRASEQAVFG